MSIDAQALLTELRPLLADLRDDLVERADDPGVQEAMRSAWRREKDARRTADPLALWTRGRATQVAAAWVLSCVFVRTLEDRGLVDRRRIAGPGAEDSEEQFVALTPFLTARDYLRTVFRELSHLPGAEGLFDARHNPVWTLGPSDAVARRLLDFFRQRGDDGELRFTFDGTDTRFLGDLYQDLDDDVRKRYALLQTPDFVESFILDETLDPALRTFSLEQVRLIDPTCGSGHFLLGAFSRLFGAWQQAEPAADRALLAVRALEQVHGADLNPYAIAIARFRLALAFLGAAGYSRLADAPPLPLNVCVADSLLHGVAGEQGRLVSVVDDEQRGQWGDKMFALEDEAEALRILGNRYHVVVGNPPYITERDRAKRDQYRDLYVSAAGKFALAAPFTERFFGLAIDCGFVGMINANSFMKREFGKKLLQEVLPAIELTLIVDTSGAYIPGCGTPTVILFGCNQDSSDSHVVAVRGIRGEPNVPDDPTNGEVWSSIRDHYKTIGFENDYISVDNVERAELSQHPLSLRGGGASELKSHLESSAHTTLGSFAETGVLGMTNADECMIVDQGAARRLGIEQDYIRHLYVGEEVRDWVHESKARVVYPYVWPDKLLEENSVAGLFRYLWRYRTTMSARATFNGSTYRNEGIPWWQWHQVAFSRLHTPFTIVFAEVATHNHFVLDRGGSVFKQTAPIIKLPSDYEEDEHHSLLGYLNSSTGCFWMKQVFFDKGNRGQGGGTTAEAWERFYQGDGTKLRKLPIPLWPLKGDRVGEIVLHLSSELCLEGERWATVTPNAHLVDKVLSEFSHDDLQTGMEHYRKSKGDLESRIRWLQEELDWAVYALYGLVTEKLFHKPAASEAKGIDAGRRVSDILFAQRVVRGDVGQRYFNLCRLAEPEILANLEMDRLDTLRTAAIERSKWLRLLETPQYKRTYRESFRPFDARSAYREWLVRRAEKECISKSTNISVVSTRDIASWLQKDTTVLSVASAYLGESSPDLERLLSRMIDRQSIPYCAGWRYKNQGLDKRQAWEATWDLQRREDMGELVDVPPPPRYKSSDFRSPAYWRLRGKLDVPQETFISYPGCESDDDPSPLIGWAGWDHLQQATALAALYQRRKDEDGWDTVRLVPMLAGLQELVPWLKQWHNDPSEEYGGMRLGDYYEAFLDEQIRLHGLTPDDLRDWRPPKRRGGRRTASAKRTSSAGGGRRGRKPRLTPDALLAALDALDTGSPEGVEQRALVNHLGVSGPTVARIATELIERGNLVLTSGRPKRFKRIEQEQA